MNLTGQEIDPGQHTDGLYYAEVGASPGGPGIAVRFRGVTLVEQVYFGTRSVWFGWRCALLRATFSPAFEGVFPRRHEPETATHHSPKREASLSFGTDRSASGQHLTED